MARRTAAPVSPSEVDGFVRRGLETTLSKQMRKAIETIRRVAITDLSVLIVGEQGSGREWAAQTIHRLSPRSEGPFHVVDCGAIPPDQQERELFGYEAISWNGVDVRRSAFEEAARGTLVLEEIELLSAAFQVRIAQAVEYHRIRHVGGETERQIDTRVLATMRRKAYSPVDGGTLHTDLLHRFSPIVIEIPPLRKRKEDIVLLIDTFLEEVRNRFGCAVEGISRNAIDICEAFDWPGNLRQLRSAIEYASVMSEGKIIQPHHLPPYVRDRDNRENLRT